MGRWLRDKQMRERLANSHFCSRMGVTERRMLGGNAFDACHVMQDFDLFGVQEPVAPFGDTP